MRFINWVKDTINNIVSIEQPNVIVPNFPLQSLDRDLLVIGKSITYTRRQSAFNRLGKWLQQNT